MWALYTAQFSLYILILVFRVTQETLNESKLRHFQVKPHQHGGCIELAYGQSNPCFLLTDRIHMLVITPIITGDEQRKFIFVTIPSKPITSFRL